MVAFLIPLVIGLGAGAFGAVQVDDAVESVTGEKSGINPILVFLMLFALMFFFFRIDKKGKAS